LQGFRFPGPIRFVGVREEEAGHTEQTANHDTNAPPDSVVHSTNPKIKLLRIQVVMRELELRNRRVHDTAARKSGNVAHNLTEPGSRQSAEPQNDG
jgi:hypothetical protein